MRLLLALHPSQQIDRYTEGSEFKSKMIRPMQKTKRGSAIVLSFGLIVLMLGISIAFLKRAQIGSVLHTVFLDSKQSELQLNSAIESGRAKLRRGIESFKLEGKLPFFPSGPTSESFTHLSNTYATNASTAMMFLKHAIEQQAMNDNGSKSSTHEFYNFDTAFPTEWTDPDETDDEYFQYKFTITARTPTTQTSPFNQAEFEYFYHFEARGYGKMTYSQSAAQESGYFSLVLSTAPFSHYALFRSQNSNASGMILVFAGGDSAAEIQDVYEGPVHSNSRPFFYGHPNFLDTFSSIVSKDEWWQGTGSGYSGEANFEGAKQGLVAEIELPTQMGNAIRLAAGDPSSSAATTTSSPTASDLASWMSQHALGSLSGNSLPQGVYIPIDNQGSKLPTGGIYVEGDARIQMNVVQGASDFNTEYWNNMTSSQKSCRFQKMEIEPMNVAVTPRDVFIGGAGCDQTLIFNPSSPSSAPIVLNGRPTGSVYLNGNLDEIGGESRTRPAIMTDFQFNIVAKGDIRIRNDIQYEDAQYVQLNPDGSKADVIVARPTGAYAGSGIEPTTANLAAVIDPESTTVLGLVSTHRSIYVHQDAPSNINIHAAIYAGNSNAFDSSTGLGCGSAEATKKGCGFGYELWDTSSNMGTIKLFGSLTEYRGQTLGRTTSPATGYSRRFTYDNRFLEDLVPLGFPISNRLQSFPTFEVFRTLRLGENE
jgi:hypothetical protein